MTTRIVDVQADSPITDDTQELLPFDDMLLMSMLESLSAYQMYRQSMQTRINRADVLTFLLRTHEFPRSLTYCSDDIRYHLSNLPNNEEPMKILRRIVRSVKRAPIAKMDDEYLHRFVDRQQIYLGQLHAAIANTYFPPAVEDAA